MFLFDSHFDKQCIFKVLKINVWRMFRAKFVVFFPFATQKVQVAGAFLALGLEICEKIRKGLKL
jgi:hypothetical protein